MKSEPFGPSYSEPFSFTAIYRNCLIVECPLIYFERLSILPHVILEKKRAKIALNRSPEFKRSNLKPSAAEFFGT